MRNNINSASPYTAALSRGMTRWNDSPAPGQFRSVTSGANVNAWQVYSSSTDWAWVTPNGTGTGCPTGYYFATNDLTFNTRTMDSLSERQQWVVAVHELGHVYGLAHTSSSCNRPSVMKTGTDKFNCTGTPPWNDDITGVTNIYRPSLTEVTARPGSRPMTYFDGPVYTSVGELDVLSDIVVRGTVEKIRSGFDEEQFQGIDIAAPSLPMTLNTIRVSRYVRGSGPATVTVQQIDTVRMPTPDATPFEAGDEVLLFLKDTGFDFGGERIHAITGMDQGYLRLRGGRLLGTPAERRSPAAGLTMEHVTAQLR
ncbi:matrixin family metalloprotease [Paractinoplanes abujensis]|uniref:Peptidase M10 metallopeptidase domain-containing protein n=1 Tax=Paractinoplanes abujensis TaxID=882441 RepID=A0A7W7CQS2_9ACTN|nr:matrixin family metalloprotease [Actinoplanes abujensis]MBB4692719.1 hypothetical protein [Actinoplanes abujensis]